MRWLRFLGVAASVCLALPAQSQNVITNGGFEGSLAGWTVFNAPSSNPPGSGRFYLITSGNTGPVSGMDVGGPYTAASGTGFAMGDQGGAGSGAIYQSFNLAGPVSGATLTFSMFVRNFAGTTISLSTLDHTGAANQHARVDLLFNMGSDFLGVGATVVRNFYVGADVVSGQAAPWINYSFDLTNDLVAPGTYTLRFAQTDNQSFFHTGVDNVVLNVGTVPEPTTVALLAIGLSGLMVAARHRRAAAA